MKASSTIVLGAITSLLAALAGADAQATSARPLEPRDFFVAGVPDTARRARLEQVFGRRDSVTTVPDPLGPGHVFEHWHFPGIMAEAFERAGQARALALTTRKWATARGLRIGDSIAKARQLYGPHHLMPANANGEQDWIIEDPDPNNELHYFRIWFRNGRVARIMFGWTSD